MEKIVGNKVAWDKQKKHLRVFFQRSVKPNRVFDDVVTDQKTKFFVKTELVSQYKGKNKYQYIYNKSNYV